MKPGRQANILLEITESISEVIESLHIGLRSRHICILMMHGGKWSGKKIKWTARTMKQLL